MGYDLRRAATALLACLAVALAAMLLPAAGIGSYPGVVGEPGPGTGPGDPGTGAGPGVSDPGSDPPTNGEPGSSTGGGTSGDPKTTEPGSSDPETSAPGDDPPTDDGPADPEDDGDALAELVGVLGTVVSTLVLLSVAGAGLLVVGLAIGGLSAGPVRLHLRGRDGTAGETLLEIFGMRVSLGGLQRLSQGSLRMVLGLSRSTGALLSGLGKTAKGVGSALAASGSLVTGLGSVGAGLARALKSGGSAVGLPAFGLGSLTTGFANWRSSFDRGDSPTSDARGASPMPGPEAGEDAEVVDTGPQSVEEAWERFVERVPLRRPEVRTPGEVARTAVRKDWPARPVRRLTHAFREVRYGGAPADDNRTRGAVSALDRLDRDDGGDDE